MFFFLHLVWNFSNVEDYASWVIQVPEGLQFWAKKCNDSLQVKIYSNLAVYGKEQKE